jgi:glycosyltransferase involved in cell wall biosynthesis
MATVGIDLTPLQGPHRMRGVGATVINTLRNLPASVKQEHSFVFYLHERDKDEALDLINASSFKNYTTHFLEEQTVALPPSIRTLKGLRHLPGRILNIIKNHRHGTRRITDVENIDVFLQFEQDIIPPPHVPSVVIVYDLIPYVLERDYLWSYSTARNIHRYSRRGALLAQLRRWRYIRTIQTVARRASKLIAISTHTKNDFIKYANIRPEKITVNHLGISDIANTPKKIKSRNITRYAASPWGDIKVNTRIPEKPYLLFVGGVDPRRKLADLVAAYNLLRAQGNDISLILAGDTMLGPHSVPNDTLRRALLSSSYPEDIYLLGFVDDAMREWLYMNALAFVYPSRYEGFGLPILEAMRYGTPTITYRNSSLVEIGEDAVLYANDPIDISNFVKSLISNKKTREEISKKAIHCTETYSWQKSASSLISTLLTPRQ